MYKCKTCKLIAEICKENQDKFGKRPYVTVLKVKLFEAIYKNNKLDGAMTYGARPLNFCPECGEMVERKQTTWK